jgi:O-antigen/teichoic acid export membrane protein
MKLSTKIAYNTIIQIISKIISTGVGLLIIAIITRYLGQTGFGEYTAATTYLSFFAIIADLGLTLVTVQLISRPGTNQNEALGNLLGLRLVSALFFLGLAPLFSFFLPYSGEVKLSIAVASFSFLFIALNQILVGLFQKELRMDKVSIAEIVNRLSLLLGVILVAHLDAGLMGIMVATVISSLISLLLHLYFARSFARLSLRFDPKYWKLITKLSWPLAITIALNLIYLKADTLLLSLIDRESSIGIIAEVGIYGAAYKVIDVLVTIPFMFSGIILPLLTKKWAENDLDGFRALMQKAFNVMAIFTIPMIFGTQMLAGQIMTIVAGQEFSLSGPILRILIFAAGIIFLGNIFAHAVIAINRQKDIIKAYLFTAVTALIAYFLFIPHFSYFGAAAVTIYSELAIAFASFYLVHKECAFKPKLTVVVKSFLASSGMYLFMLWLSNTFSSNILFLSIAGAITYFFLFIIMKGLSRDEIKSLLNR